MRLSPGLSLGLRQEAVGPRLAPATRLLRRFVTTATGGLILLLSTEEGHGVAEQRGEAQRMVNAFATGDFRVPGVPSGREAPGLKGMVRRRDEIGFAAQPVPLGAEIVLQGRGAPAIAAIHAFLDFHRRRSE